MILMWRWKLLSNRNDTPVSDPTNRRSPNDEEEKEGAGDQQEQEVGGHLELVVGRHQEILRNRWSTSGRNVDQELLRNRRRLSGTCWRTSGSCQNRNCCWSSEVVNGDHIRKVGGRIGNQGLPGFNNLIISGFWIWDLKICLGTLSIETYMYVYICIFNKYVNWCKNRRQYIIERFQFRKWVGETD